jgi:hypothetical protein
VELSLRSLDRRFAWALFLGFAALFLATAVGLPDNPDAEVEFQTTRSLARDQTFAIGGTPEAAAIEALGFDVVRGVDGRAYAWLGVGQALAGVPFYALGSLVARAFPELETRHTEGQDYGFERSEYFEHLFVGLCNPLLGAWTCALLFLAARRLGASRAAALASAVLFGTTTYFWPQARATLNDVQATWALVLAFERWLAWRDDERASTAFLCGVAAAWAVLTRVALAPAVAVFVVAVLLERLRARRVVALATQLFAVAILAGLALFVATNLTRFARPFETGYGPTLARGTFFSYPWYEGLAGLLLSPGKGLLWFATGLVVALFGWRHVERRIALTVAAIAVAVFAPVVCTQAWHGAYTYGPRYVLPAVALGWLGVAPALERAVLSRSRAALLAIAGLFAFGASVSLAGVAVDTMTHLDLAAQCARSAWPDLPVEEPPAALPAAERQRERERRRDEARFVLLQWDLRFAAPFAHWRIFAQQVTEGHDFYDPRELFGVEAQAALEPSHARERGFLHFAWVDLAERLGGVVWPVWSAIVGLFVASLGLAWTARRRPQGEGTGSR